MLNRRNGINVLFFYANAILACVLPLSMQELSHKHLCVAYEIVLTLLFKGCVVTSGCNRTRILK